MYGALEILKGPFCGVYDGVSVLCYTPETNTKSYRMQTIVKIKKKNEYQ